jgi:hypothetical protein
MELRLISIKSIMQSDSKNPNIRFRISELNSDLEVISRSKWVRLGQAFGICHQP